jgi:hypothetical protein
VKVFNSSGYADLISFADNTEIDQVQCLDHLDGFASDLSNQILDKMSSLAARQHRPVEFYTSYVVDDTIKSRYPGIVFRTVFFNTLQTFQNYNLHPEPSHIKFLCSFNGSLHVGRKLLVAALEKFGWFDPEVCSKNFEFSVDDLDGHLADYLDPVVHRLYRPLFISKDSTQFFSRLYSFGHVRFDHAQNIHNLERQLTASWLHLVSETMATSYYPFVTEKFLYSVVTRGLFLAYGQPGWHQHIEKYYGFRRYDRIFDYRFDSIQNPIHRLLELLCMLSKFAVLTPDELRDLYELEVDTIEYNYDWYFSGDYIRHHAMHSQ